MGGLTPVYHQKGMPKPNIPGPTNSPPIHGKPMLKPQPNAPTAPSVLNGRPAPMPAPLDNNSAAAGVIAAADAMVAPIATNSFLNISDMPPFMQTYGAYNVQYYVRI